MTVASLPKRRKNKRIFDTQFYNKLIYANINKTHKYLHNVFPCENQQLCGIFNIPVGFLQGIFPYGMDKIVIIVNK